MKRLLLLLVALVALLAGPGRAVATLELPDLAERAKPSVVLLTVYDAAGVASGSGTAFFVHEDGLLATNEHVVAGASRVTAALSDGRELEVAGLVASDPEKDIAVLKVVGEELPPPLELGSTEGVRAGDEVVVLGSPRGLSGTLSTGIVSAIRAEGLDGGLDGERTARGWGIQITAAISPGSSGSPVMTRKGKVIGVAVGLMEGGGSLHFAVPVEVVEGLLSELGPDPRIEPFTGGGSGIARNLVISLVFFGAVAVVLFVSSRWRKRPAKKAPLRR